jgi:hypothetical protein
MGDEAISAILLSEDATDGKVQEVDYLFSGRVRRAEIMKCVMWTH